MMELHRRCFRGRSGNVFQRGLRIFGLFSLPDKMHARSYREGESSAYVLDLSKCQLSLRLVLTTEHAYQLLEICSVLHKKSFITRVVV